MIPAIPTTGPDGVNFRSRLEARWAQFFTLCGWPWQYEPDMDFKGWIPDFAIISGGGLLVEVKPAVSMPGLMEHRARIEKSGAVAQIWLVGASLSLGQKDYLPVLGWHGFAGGDRLHGEGLVWMWYPARLSTIKGLIDQHDPVDFKVAQRLWVQAGNELQWRKK